MADEPFRSWMSTTGKWRYVQDDPAASPRMVPVEPGDAEDPDEELTPRELAARARRERDESGEDGPRALAARIRRRR